MGKEFKINTTNEMCALMCDNAAPKKTRKRKSLCDIARDIRGGVLESRTVARMDDLNRPLTDQETVNNCWYIYTECPYFGCDYGDIRAAAKYVLKKGEERGIFPNGVI